MTISLKRYESNRCYLRGKLLINDKFFCDTMEFNNETSLKEGQYFIKVLPEPTTGERRVYLVDQFNQIISKLVKNNCENLNNVRIRRKNSLIEIGLYNKTSELVMFSYINQGLISAIRSALNINELIVFHVLNQIPDNYEEKKVTEY